MCRRLVLLQRRARRRCGEPPSERRPQAAAAQAAGAVRPAVPIDRSSTGGCPAGSGPGHRPPARRGEAGQRERHRHPHLDQRVPPDEAATGDLGAHGGGDLRRPPARRGLSAYRFPGGGEGGQVGRALRPVAGQERRTEVQTGGEHGGEHGHRRGGPHRGDPRSRLGQSTPVAIDAGDVVRARRRPGAVRVRRDPGRRARLDRDVRSVESTRRAPSPRASLRDSWRGRSLRGPRPRARPR